VPAEAAEFDVAAWAQTGPEGYDSFGDWVSASAKDDRVKSALKAKGVSFGAVVSGWANGKGVDEEVLAALGVAPDESADAPVAPESGEAAGTETTTEQTPATVEESASQSNGKGNSGKAKDNGNGAKGNGKGNGRN
jgi:hypothetical protein